MLNREDETALSVAAQNGHEDVVKLLLQRSGIIINCKCYRQRTPLMWAAKYGHGGVARMLLEADGIHVRFSHLLHMSW